MIRDLQIVQVNSPCMRYDSSLQCRSVNGVQIVELKPQKINLVPVACTIIFTPDCGLLRVPSNELSAPETLLLPLWSLADCEHELIGTLCRHESQLEMDLAL